MATITLFVHSPSTRVSSERRLPLSDDLYAIRGRLERITGIPSEHQCIQLWTARTDEEDANIASGQRLVWDSSYKMSPLPSSLLAVGAQDGMGLKVLDERPADVASRLVLSEDNSSVQSFAMTDEEYQRRQDTFLAFKQRNKLGRFDPQTQTQAQSRSQLQQQSGYSSLVSIPLASRCELLDEAPPARRGTVRYVGQPDFAPQGQTWVGIEFDEPVGKNDGSVQETRYFTCKPQYGGFVKADKISVGEYPPRILDNDDGEDIEEL